MNNPWNKIESPSKDVSALRANASHPLDLFWAKDHLGRYLFIYEYPLESDVVINEPPDLTGIETISMSSAGKVARLVLVLNDKADWELFFSLCQDLLNATMNIQTPETASSAILQRLRRWHDFLKKKRLNILSEEKIKGLIGELLFLRNHLEPVFGSANAVKFWLGPEGSPQDFNINDSAVEVKCQLGGTNPNVKITSADQLSSLLPKMFLFVITLGKSTNGNIDAVNLPTLVSDITSRLEKESSQALICFQDLLLEAGYYHSEKYFEYNYILVEEHVYNVTREFPRICPEDISSGIIKLTYNISLAECMPYEIELSKWELLNG